jgi:hypothetical protein
MKWSRWQCLPKGRVDEGDQIAHSQNIHLDSGSISIAWLATRRARIIGSAWWSSCSDCYRRAAPHLRPHLSSSFQFYFGVNKLDILRDEVQRDETDIQFISGTKYLPSRQPKAPN